MMTELVRASGRSSPGFVVNLFQNFGDLGGLGVLEGEDLDLTRIVFVLHNFGCQLILDSGDSHHDSSDISSEGDISIRCYLPSQSTHSILESNLNAFGTSQLDFLERVRNGSCDLLIILPRQARILTLRLISSHKVEFHGDFEASCKDSMRC